MANAEMGGNPEAERMIADIQALQEEIQQAAQSNPERVPQLQERLAKLVGEAQQMGIIK